MASPTERKILHLLMEAADQGVLKSELCRKVFGDASGASTEVEYQRRRKAAHRMIERCIKAMVKAGAEITMRLERKERRFILKSPPAWDDSLGADVPLALELAAMSLSHLGTPLWESQLDLARQLVAKHLPATARKQLETLSKHVKVYGGVDDPVIPVNEPILERLLDAIESKRKVKLTYRKENSIYFPEAAPWMICHDMLAGGAYLLAWDEAKKAPRSYKLCRIEALEILESKRAVISDPIQMDRAVKYQIGAWVNGDEPMEVVARFEGSYWMQVMTESRPALPDFTVTPEEDGECCLVRFKANCSKGALRWLLQFGQCVEVLEPDSLRGEMREEVEGMWRKLGR